MLVKFDEGKRLTFKPGQALAPLQSPRGWFTSLASALLGGGLGGHMHRLSGSGDSPP